MTESRLERDILRRLAQRAHIEAAVAALEGRPGVLLELGLGHGNTYDHLCRLCPARDIYAFDREVYAPPELVPDPAYLLVGEFAETLPALAARIGRSAVLAHADILSPEPRLAAQNRRGLLSGLVALLVEGAILLVDQPLDDPRLRVLPPPPTAPPGRYHAYVFSLAY